MEFETIIRSKRNLEATDFFRNGSRVDTKTVLKEVNDAIKKIADQ